ncbi:hypothetical protein LXL04_026139 [Taraxacum kok-saghyz]
MFSGETPVIVSVRTIWWTLWRYLIDPIFRDNTQKKDCILESMIEHTNRFQSRYPVTNFSIIWNSKIEEEEFEEGWDASKYKINNKNKLHIWIKYEGLIWYEDRVRTDVGYTNTLTQSRWLDESKQGCAGPRECETPALIPC